MVHVNIFGLDVESNGNPETGFKEQRYMMRFTMLKSEYKEYIDKRHAETN